MQAVDILDLIPESTRSREKYPDVQVLEAVENQDGAEICHSLTLELLKHYPQLAGIYIAEGGSPFGIARALVEAGRAGRIKLVIHNSITNIQTWLSS